DARHPEAGRALFDDEGADATAGARLGRGIRYGEDGHQIGNVAPRYVVLGAVEDEAIAIASRARFDGLRVRARVRLGEGKRGDPLARGQTRQPALLLRL